MIDSVKEICKGRGPLLLALSGGADSTALYHLMKEIAHPFEVVHIDHSWREESKDEAALLQNWVDVPFHLRHLQKPDHNAEDEARQGRLGIYKKILQERGLEAVLLGHHADDQAETVLKRVFEGARLTKLVGLEKERVVDGLCLLRPLLDFRKKELIAWLQARNISYFVETPSNDLRSKMRLKILPFLSENFGKEIVPTLCRLAQDAKELREEKENFWLKEVVSDYFEQQGVSPTRPTLNSVSSHLARGSRKKEMRIGKGRVSIDAGILTYNKRIDEE